MRKTQTRITLLVMALVALLVAPVAQAQNRLYEIKVFTTPTDARAGGENEMSGGVLLNFTPKPLNTMDHGHSRLLRPSRRRHSCRPPIAQSTAAEEGLTTSLSTTVAGDGGERR